MLRLMRMIALSVEVAEIEVHVVETLLKDAGPKWEHSHIGTQVYKI